MVELYPPGPIACTLVDGVLTVCMTAWQGDSAHVAVFTVRDGKASAPVHVNTDTPLSSVYELACASVNGQLQVIVTGIAGGKLVCWHTVRGSNGASWQRWGDLAGVLSLEVLKIAAASIGDDLEAFLATSNKLWHAIRRPDGTWALDDVTSHAGGLPGAPYAVAAAAVPESAEAQTVPQPQGFESIRVRNSTGGDSLVVWSYDLATGQSSDEGTIDAGETLSVALDAGHYVELIVVSENAVAEHNRTFGTSLDADDFSVAVTANYQKAWSVFFGGGAGEYDWDII